MKFWTKFETHQSKYVYNLNSNLTFLNLKCQLSKICDVRFYLKNSYRGIRKSVSRILHAEFKCIFRTIIVYIIKMINTFEEGYVF